MGPDRLDEFLTQIRACTRCAADLPHGPRPIVQAGVTAQVLIIGQAPGTKVHTSGIPWNDASGERLREWTGLAEAVFYDPGQVALMPMGFCFPGTGPSGDLPPRAECAPLWHGKLRGALGDVRLTLLVGHHAQARYLPARPRRSMTEAVRAFADAPPGLFPLPHPSWRSTLWMRQNPWFEQDVLPELRSRIAAALPALPA